MDDKKLSVIDKVFKLTQQDTEFKFELLKKLGVMNSINSPTIEDERINQIYEYCIEKIIRKQAEEFYNDFPLKSIIPSLVEDFIRMESFKRKDNFGDFCLSLYQQIECITNKLCESQKLTNITEKLWGYPAYIKQEQGKEISIKNRSESNYTIAALVFPGQNKKTGIPNSIEKSQITLQSQYAYDKIRIIVYFLGYKGMMKISDYDSYKEITSLLYDIYQCRNMNHRGNTQNEWEIETRNRILPLKSFYYFKFHGVLAQYIEFVKSGLKALDEIHEYSKTISTKKIELPEPKIVGKIDLPPNTKRFKK